MNLAASIAVILVTVVSPRPNARVHDFAELLSPADRQSLETLARDVERETTAEMAIVTVRSLDGMPVEKYAVELFNQWGIGKKGLNNGVLLLVAPNERRMWITTGYGIEPLLTDGLCGEIRDRQIIPRFKVQDYAGGIRDGARELARIIRSDPKAARGDPDSGPVLARAKRREAMWGSGALAVAAIVLLALGFVVAHRRLYSTTTFMTASAIGFALLGTAAFLTLRAPGPGLPLAWFGTATAATLGAWCFNFFRYRRFGPHGCSKCGTHLELLSEQNEDPKLSAVQRLEERIGSVDYDVCICPACLNNDTERYLKPFSGFGDCDACKARAFKENPQKVIKEASTISAGKARIDGRCVACNHKSVRFVVLPKIQESSSSNGGSFGGGGFGGGGGGGGFGGGSSGGGGAGGGW